MLSPELLIIAAILVFQPLIALLWAFLVFRLAVSYTARRAESAVDGRIEKLEKAIREK